MRVLALFLIASLPVLNAHAKDENTELAACRPYMDLCKHVEPGEGRQMRCMYEKRAQLSSQCATVITEKYERYVELMVIKAQKEKGK